jgi:hypothetical protein
MLIFVYSSEVDPLSTPPWRDQADRWFLERKAAETFTARPLARYVSETKFHVQILEED